MLVRNNKGIHLPELSFPLSAGSSVLPRQDQLDSIKVSNSFWFTVWFVSPPHPMLSTGGFSTKCPQSYVSYWGHPHQACHAVGYRSSWSAGQHWICCWPAEVPSLVCSTAAHPCHASISTSPEQSACRLLYFLGSSLAVLVQSILLICRS